MKKIELLAMLGESKDIIDYLQQKGTVQVEKCDAPESMYYTDTDSSVSQLERLLQTAENARETISFYSPEKKKLTDSFLPRKEVELSDFYEESEKTDVAMAKCREIIDIKKEIADKKADIIREQTAREALIPWKGLIFRRIQRGQGTRRCLWGRSRTSAQRRLSRPVLPQLCRT